MYLNKSLIISNVPPSFQYVGTQERGNVETAYVEVPPQILGNVEGYVKVFNIGEPMRNTTKFILEYIKIESWSISH